MYENVNINQIWDEVCESKENEMLKAAEEAEGAEGADELEEAKFDEDYDSDKE